MYCVLYIVHYYSMLCITSRAGRRFVLCQISFRLDVRVQLLALSFFSLLMTSKHYHKMLGYLTHDKVICSALYANLKYNLFQSKFLWKIICIMIDCNV